MKTTLNFTDNPDNKRFEAAVEGKTILIEYIKAKDKFYLTHTEVPPSLEGKGYGSQMVKRALEEVEKSGLKLVPLCPFVAAYLKRHPEWKKLLADGYSV